MGRIFGKLADSTFVRIGLIEFKNGIITGIEHVTKSPLKTHRYDPKSYVIFPGFVDPLVRLNDAVEEEQIYKARKAGFTNVRLVPCGPLKTTGKVARLREADADQYVADFAPEYTQYPICDIIKVHEALINSLKKHVTFVPEWQSSLDRFKTNVTQVSRHPIICELEGLELAVTVAEKYLLTAGFLVTCYASLKRIYELFKRGFAVYPIIPIRNLVSSEESLDVPPLRDDATRMSLAKNAPLIDNSIFTNFSDIQDLRKFGPCVADLIRQGMSLKAIANAASAAPNRFLGIADCGNLKVGMKANFTVLSEDGAVETYVDGELV
jgi:hypothetical protein